MERELDMMITLQDDLWYGEVPLTEAEKQVRMKVPLYYRMRIWAGKIFKGLVKALVFLLMTPFFLLIWLRNTIILSISFSIIYIVINLMYYTFINDIPYYKLDSVMFEGVKAWFLLGSIFIVGLCAAIYDFKDKFLDIWHL